MDRPLALGATPFPAPLGFGHECVADVIAVGSDVTAVSPGQRVVVPFEINCGECVACRTGRTANCLAVPPLSMYGFGVLGGHWGGAIADRVCVPFADGMLVPLPDSIHPELAASVADNVCDGYRHIGPHLPKLIARGMEPRVIVLGAVNRRSLFTASVPLYACLVAKALGAEEVQLVDIHQHVHEHAHRLGLTAVTPHDAKRLPPAPLIADISGAPTGLRLAIKLAAPDGIVSSSGMLHARASIPTSLMFGRNTTVTIARAHTRALIPDVLALIEENRLRPDLVTTVTAPIDDAPKVLSEHLQGQSTKTILTAA